MNMPKKEKQYKRLPGRGRKTFSRHALWMGSDHLMAIRTFSYSESYKRFYYSDIQAVIIRRLDYWKVVSIILALLSVFIYLIAFFSGNTGTVVSIIFGTVFLLCFLVYVLWGANCESYIQTGIQIEKLPSLNRLKSTQKTLAFLQPRIERVQGKLSRDALRETLVRQAPGPVQTRSAPPQAEKTPVRKEKGIWHAALFGLLLLIGAVGLTDFFYQHIALTIVSTLITMAAAICMIIALVKQGNSDLPEAVRTITWMTVVFICITAVTAYIVNMVLVIRNMERINALNSQWELIKMMTQISPFDNLFYVLLGLFKTSASMILGSFGLIRLREKAKKG